MYNFIFFVVATINQFLTDVSWGDIDYLIIDTPPGTSDEHITVIEKMRYLSTLMAIKFKNMIFESNREF